MEPAPENGGSDDLAQLEEDQDHDLAQLCHGEGSVASIATRRTRLSYVTCQSEFQDKADFLDVGDLDEFPEDQSDQGCESQSRWWKSVVEVASDPRAQQTAAVTVGGYLTMGITGGTGGMVCGGSIGALVGLAPAPFTAGLSVPLGAAVGAGLCVGASVGSTVGAVGGLLVGRGVFYRQPHESSVTGQDS